MGRIVLLFCVSLCVFVSALFAEEATSVEERAEILAFLAAQNEANFKALHTWEGKYRFADSYRVPKSILGAQATAGPAPSENESSRQPDHLMLYREGAIEFKFDSARESFISHFAEDGETARLQSVDGEPIPVPAEYTSVSRSTMVTPGETAQYMPGLEYGPIPDQPNDPVARGAPAKGLIRIAGSLHRTELFNQADEVFDPRDLFSTGRKLLWSTLQLHAEALRGQHGEISLERFRKNLTIDREETQSGLAYTITVKYISGTPRDEQGLPYTETRFEERAGFLPVEYKFMLPNGKPHRTQRWRYRRQDGLFVPEEFHYTFARTSDGEQLLERHLTLKESNLNGRLEGGFEIVDLGPEPGDRILDTVTDTLEVWDGEKAVAPSENLPTMGSRKTSPMKVYFWGNVVAIIVVAGIVVAWIIRRRKYNAP